MIELVTPPPRLEDIDLSLRIDKKENYLTQLEHLQLQMLQVQQAYYDQQRRAVIVFEGWDTAGKGGAIRRMTEKLDPRGFNVYPIGVPSEEEQSLHYLHRFMRRLPESGTMAIFDRSWYGRVLVEPIENLISPEQYQHAFQEINDFEWELIQNGTRIVKIFLHISPDEQLRRFDERLSNRNKHWKLSEEDIRNREKWSDYHQAINTMFEKTSTTDCPWHVIAGNYKWYARLTVLKEVIEVLQKDVDLTTPIIDEKLIRQARIRLGLPPK